MNNSTNSSVTLQISQPFVQANNDGWCAAFALEALFIAFGNGISILALLNMRSNRKLRKWFLVSLSIADVLVGALALPMFVYVLDMSTRKPSQTFAIFSLAYNSIDIFTGLASVFTLTVISLERLYALLMPLSHRSTRRRYYMIIIGILWCLAALISLVFWLTYIHHLLPPWIFIYAMTIVSFGSVGIIIIVYVAVWAKIKFFLPNRSKLLGADEERSIFIALGIVTVVFVCTWLPFNVINLIANFHTSYLKNLTFDAICVVKFLHYSNSFINPIVYSLKIPEFRRSCFALFVKLNRNDHELLNTKTRETKL